MCATQCHACVLHVAFWHESRVGWDHRPDNQSPRVAGGENVMVTQGADYAAIRRGSDRRGGLRRPRGAVRGEAVG
jgi:hypothetical protein